MRRLRTSTTGTTSTTQHYDDLSAGGSESPSWTASSTGAWTRYIGGLDGSMALQQDTTGAVTLMITNFHGDTIATMGDYSETTISTLSEQTEFGQERPGQTALTTTGLDDYGWLGAKQRDQDSLGGLTLMGERLYDPAIGRFLQTDPVLGGSCNNYDYACQNPITGFDLNGQLSPSWSCQYANTCARLPTWKAIGITVALGALQLVPGADVAADAAIAGEDAEGGSALGEAAFNSRSLGVGSRLFGNSGAEGGQSGLLNPAGRGDWRLGWSRDHVNYNPGRWVFRAKYAGNYKNLLRGSR
jgi:RHS repeat-associated protein